MKKNNGSYFSADEMKRLCDDAFGRVFPEVVQMEKCKKEKGKITEDDIKRIFSMSSNK